MSEVIAPAGAIPGDRVDTRDPPPKHRTAVLVVHGIGSQRALETVRGVVDAAWLQDANDPTSDKPPRQVWTHPEFSGVDIDLSVITTSRLLANTPSGPQDRSIDFHELYWAHLMSETRAIAVLLWLFELVRKGPRLKSGMRALWWGATIFLCTFVASITLIVLHAILMFAGKEDEPEVLLLAPLFVILVVAAYSAIASSINVAWKIAVPAILLAAFSYWLLSKGISGSETGHLTKLFLPTVAAICAAGVVMGRWGIAATITTYVGASIFLIFYLNLRYQIYWDPANPIADMIAHKWIPFFTPEWRPFYKVWTNGWLVWSLTEQWSTVIACSVIVLYFAINALFLQSYLGDAARYFRNSPANVGVRRDIRKQAVETLEGLHTSGRYDRIIVVAHSLGTVIAYDMLRAYFSRICSDLPRPADLQPEFDVIDKWPVGPVPKIPGSFRDESRAVIRKMFHSVDGAPVNSARDTKAWLVTDFVTVGSALTHAQYLMCTGDTQAKLEKDFVRRQNEREFPTCPPRQLGKDGLLSFQNPNTRRLEFHNGALFGLTRWTNLYFKLDQLFWGDAIGGQLAPLFGSHISDIEVSTYEPFRSAFFTHTAYWSLNWPAGRKAPQIEALKKAINLKDE